MRICIIGAGPSGIAGAKNLLDAGLKDIVVFDRGDEVGGNWVFDATSDHASVFETTRSISSKARSQYCDYPMPAEYPHYPSHRELAAYFQGYARHFGLCPLIRFGAQVERCTPSADGRWVVTTQCDGVRATNVFDHLVVANGHHWQPRWPDYPSRFTGEYLHAHGYKRAAPFAGRRVLVIGGGNSSCDIAVALSGVAASVDLSWRRGYYILPKFFLGVPADLFHDAAPVLRRRVPRRLRAWVNRQLWRGARFSNGLRGLPMPFQPLSATHPTINAELPGLVWRRRIRCSATSRDSTAPSCISSTVHGRATTPSSRARAISSRIRFSSRT
jgi:cation diffusion facilitator CzcD-associated flavoprotein CzcO